MAVVSRVFAWAWLIVIGGLLITPEGVLCIACGVGIDVPGYIGRTAVTVLGIGSIGIGIAGLVTTIRAANRQVV
jgi:hypothetical protein